METCVYLTQTYRSSVGIRRNGHDFGSIVHSDNAHKNFISLALFRTMEFYKRTFLLNSDLLLIIETGHRFNCNDCKLQIY